MRPLRAIFIGILVWILIFIEISVFKIWLGFAGILQQSIHYILVIPIMVLGAWLYYRKKDKLNGFLLGIILLAVGIILDLVITIPIFINMQTNNLALAYSTFYSDIYLWIGFLEGVVVAGIYGLLRKR